MIENETDTVDTVLWCHGNALCSLQELKGIGYRMVQTNQPLYTTIE